MHFVNLLKLLKSLGDVQGKDIFCLLLAHLQFDYECSLPLWVFVEVVI